MSPIGASTDNTAITKFPEKNPHTYNSELNEKTTQIFDVKREELSKNCKACTFEIIGGCTFTIPCPCLCEIL